VHQRHTLLVGPSEAANVSAVPRRRAELRAAEERAAVNTVSQGSGADIAKTAMAHLHAALATDLPHGAAQIVHMVCTLNRPRHPPPPHTFGSHLRPPAAHYILYSSALGKGAI